MAVRIGRAIGNERAAIVALQAEEKDKARFCIENDPLGTALIEMCREKPFTGSAADLHDTLIWGDNSVGRWTAKRIGKRLSALWPHLEKILVASKETDRKGFTIYKFAEFAEFQEVFPQNSPCKNSYAKFCEKTLLNSANSALQNNNTCGMDASL